MTVGLAVFEGEPLKMFKGCNSSRGTFAGKRAIPLKLHA
jgi:hypothetical protein